AHRDSDARSSPAPARRRTRRTHGRAARNGLLPERPTRHKDRERSAPSLSHSSYEISQFSAHFLRRAEQAVLGGLFGGFQNLSDGPQPHALVVAQLEHHALAWGQLLQGGINLRAQLPVPKAP